MVCVACTLGLRAYALAAGMYVYCLGLLLVLRTCCHLGMRWSDTGVARKGPMAVGVNVISPPGHTAHVHQVSF